MNERRAAAVGGVATCIAALSSPALPAGPPDGILPAYDFGAPPSLQWKLPDKLNEISGLAVTPDGRLLAVADEAAIVYELDYAQGKLVKAFALGNPTVPGDFEGIAVLDDRIWLVTSDGVIYEAAEGADGERVEYEAHPTEAGESCEREGLALRAEERILLLLCKKLRRNSKLDRLAIFAWSTERRTLLPRKMVILPDRQIASELRAELLRPSGIAVDGTSGNLLIVASRPKAVIELTADGTFVSAAELASGARHRQPEGIELLGDGRLLIADEGGSHKARLAVYGRQAAAPGGMP